ncbi:MAG TPA: CNNM domain-containing protein [Candidatus Saccharimonadales bacterium]|jgi:metal transporter CNNM|nr:CNNM domain-containing protein [Candidatus Saccharimonadales bacterium]
MWLLSIGIEVVVLVGMSAVCSGLNISLMALDAADLRRKAKTGNADAARVLPLRKNSHLTLAGILLTNVAAVSATSLVLERRFNGVIAGAASTLLIVIFGEIMPQALFARNALKLTARFSPVLKVMIAITYPISKPLQLLLDKLFGHDAPHLQSRHELGMLLAEHTGDTKSELDEDEVEIMKGALTLSEKRVRDIMTPIKNVYWVTPNTIIDAQKIDEIKANAWSRIPVLDKQRTMCYGLLLMKDLVDINFDEESFRADDLPLYTCETVGSMTALDTMFRKFINGRSHLVPIERNDKIVGIVTIEDLLEEIVGHEIEDESDQSRRHPRSSAQQK